MVQKVVVVTGANRGLGFEFVKQLSLDSEPQLDALTAKNQCDKFVIIALTRKTDDPQLNALQLQIKEQNTSFVIPRSLVIMQCEVADETDVLNIKKRIIDEYDGRVDVLLCNAGIAEASPEFDVTKIVSQYTQDVDGTNKTNHNQIYQVNAMAPVIMTNIFASLLHKANDTLLTPAERQQLTANENKQFDSTIDPGTNTDDKTTQSKTLQHVQCAYVSSTLGSLAFVNSPLAPTYSASKAALNMYVRKLALAYPSINFCLLSPGWCQTDMGSRGGRNPPTRPEDSIKGMFKQMNDKSFNFDSGNGLYSWDNDVIPW